MNLHQVLTGAVNPGDNCFSVGSLHDQPFTAYASGCDIVVLGTDFERLQIIPGAKHGNIQVGCVDCSMQQGKIAASYGNVICIFEPVSLLKQNRSHHNTLHYQWQKNAQILLEAIAHNLTWDPTGTRLLTGSSCLQLWSNVLLENPSVSDNTERTDVGLGEWRCIWQCKTASQVCLMKFSPDGEFFATAGKDDCLVKVWYNTDSWRSAVAPPGASPEKQAKEVDFSFVYLAHPRSVNAFSWRKTSKFMPRGAVCNVLLTCCKDNVCRLWAETLLPNDSLLYGGGYNNWSEAVNFTNNFKRNTSSKEKVQNALELNLRHFRRGRRRSGTVVAHTGYAPHQQDPHEVHRNIPPHANALCHFHIAASINPATDIPLLPSITSLSLGENEEKSGPFVVHWLNNKELHFTLSMEVFLQQLKKSFEHHSPETNTEESNQMDSRSMEEVDENGDEQKGNQEKKELGDEKSPNSSLVPLSSAIIDHEIEVLLSEWSKNADMLFSIHPMDGSLLVWHVDWLDEYQPGMFRQVQVSFVSRIPVAFPTGDANSLCRSIVMYACTKNVDLAIQQGKQKPPGLTRSSSMLISSGHSKSTNSLKLSIFTPNVMMISKHADGSLNQWLVSFAEESAFSTVLSISHKSRYCGHRFHLNDLACHSVLPLLLTTSHHNALISPDVENAKQANDSLKSQESPVRLQSRGNADVTSQDPNAVYSELILWRVDPVGPLSFSGGVSELARINSLHVSAFSNVAWLPTLIPSYCLGAYCNSPSACFVASDGQHLRLYQAVIDAKKLLCELSSPEISKYVGEVFNIVSQQSTARPGCIIELDAITELHGRKTQLFHVFQEDFILNNQEKKTPEKNNNLPDSGNQQNGFSEKFYLIVIEYTQNRSLLHMWHLHLKSIPVSVDEKIDSNTPEAATQAEELYPSPDPEKIQSPFTQKYQACRANLQSTSWLTLSSRMVYSQELSLPEGVEIISVKPSAGHLSSSSIYPVCRAPYLLATSCSDGKVRFWRCRVTTESSASSMPEYSAHSDVTYVWEEWPLLIEDGLLSSSAINVPGRPTEVSCAHTNRLAVAYKQATSKNSHLSQDFIMHVSIFECESTGGSSWILEQTLHLDEIGTMLDSGVSIDSNLVAYNRQDIPLSHGGNIMPSTKHLVHLDWMSREDGSHILTVGIGSKLFMFGQLSGKMQEQNGKEIVAISHSGSTKATTLSRFVLLRCVDLVSSVEGSPPFPVSLSWVRDGILVVGMDCEMHVYSQWQSPSKQELVSTDSYSGSMPCIPSLMKQSQSAASSVHPPKRTLTRSMTSLAQKLSGKRSACDLSTEMEDSGLFEAAHTLSPTLPQYHPYQLLELMDLGKVRRAKAILSHLVKCIAGEVVAVNESEPNHDKRLRSLTISASGSTARDPKTFSKTETTDYIEIDSVPPLPLYALLAADDDSSHSCSEKSNNQNSQNKKDMPNDNYEDLFQNTVISTDELVTFDADEDSSKPKVIDLSQYSPTYFGPEHAQVLSRHLLHSSLPGLTRMEQMSLMALADTISTTSTDIGESRDRNQGGETLDECGLKFLLAVRLHTFLTTSLPPVHRAQLLHQGLSTSHFAWAFHSVAEEELLSMLPAVQKGDPTWSELRAMGIGWWVRNIHSLRKCIEKVAKAAFQRNNDPLDAAIFYLAMKKKAVIWGLYRSQKDTKMTQFFGNNFTEDRWRKAALKNAFSLLGKQRFEHSAAFFLLAGHLKDAVEEQSTQIPSSPLPEQSSIPLLFACTASAKTVVANPLLHLGNLTHDILHAIINIDSPPHPDTQNNKIYVMHTLAASLSACIYQCLCDGHSYSSFQANQFTGTVYQTVLLTQRHSLRTTSLEETVTPNTSPAQWPGITALIRLLNSAGEEAQPGLTVLLCEILTAVYLSLFIHGLATHSSNELYRIMAHPLNNKMWSAIFGGGAHMPSRGQLQLKTKTGRHFPMPSPHQVVVFSMECVGFSKSLTAFSTHSPTKSSGDGETQQKRYRLSSKTSPKESSQSLALPLVDQESPSYKERFIPPELSIWDYFIAKPFLPSQSRVEYDSEESQESGEDDEDIDGDVFASNSHNQEHSNSNSYSWSLMRLAMVQLVLHNLKIFYPLAGHDLSELPVSSPICHAVLKTLQRWEQVLLRRLELYGGPPQHYISVHASEDALAAGPALLRHKTLLEPTNTPFRSNSHVALSVKRLWQYLVKQEEVQETFIRNIFTKKRCLNESLEEHNETMKNSVVEESIVNKIETDLGYPGGKARIIHKESDIITAFAVNKANRNCIAIASSHDIQELDVSAILATQIYTWVDDDVEIENKGADDFLVIHARDDLVNVQGTTPYTHSNPGTPINMPWLGSTQTGRGASVEYSNKFNGIRKELARKEMLKKAINNVRRMASHPTLPYYLTGAQDGSVRMFEWGHAQQITCFRSGGNSRVTRMRFNYQGNKFGIVDADGCISLYQTNWKCCPLTGTSPKPYLTWQCHNKTANDFVFISSSSLIATAGLSSDNRNICLWDTLVSPANSLVHAFICHDSGATVLAYAPKHQLLISGGRKGFTCIIDLRQKQQQQLLQSHDSPVKAIAVDPTEEYFVTGSAEGNIKVWSLSTFNLLHTFISEHARQSLFRNIGTGVMQIETGPANHIFSCGADGTVKMRILPDRFSPLNDVLKNDVKFMI
ncbi:dmX-like protein 1 isoform X8 [Aptenodytes patagonicus]|uniref:dmX-like protein 1 isoform X8 n=1 Tax=Aptenodytes patagonicus TaxID=9234 RepID=UPI003FA12ED4